MKILTICWARNECDILEAFVRHHAQYGAVMVVLHRCRDNSAEILAALAKEGLPITWRTDERLEHAQTAVLTALMQEAFEEGNDWVFPLDADEFLVGDVVSELQAHENNTCCLRVRWKGYVPRADDPAQERHVLRRITHRKSSEYPEWSKILVPRSAFESGSQLYPGNHELSDPSGNIVDTVLSSLTLAHFPVRSVKQITRKVYTHWLSSCANPRREPHESFQWKVLFDELKNGRELTPPELTTMAIDYASNNQLKRFISQKNDSSAFDRVRKIPTEEVTLIHEGVPCNFDILYPILEADPITILMETAEETATAYAVLSKQKPYI